MKYHKQFRARRLKQILHHYEMIRWCNRHNKSRRNKAAGWLRVANEIEGFTANLRKNQINITILSSGGSVKPFGQSSEATQ